LAAECRLGAGSAADRHYVSWLEPTAVVNDLYFACTDCKTYADCGYRWAYWTLEHPGIVLRAERIDAQRVLDAKEYWHPPQEPQSAWLYDEVLPSVRAFLAEHAKHNLLFWEINDLPDDRSLEWLQVGHHPYPTARYLAEVLKANNWDEALAWIASNPLHPWAANDVTGRDQYRAAFERHLAAVRPAR